MPVQKVSTYKAGAIGEVFRCSIIGSGPDGTHINTFYLRQVVASFTGNVFDDIKTTWDGVLKATYLAMFPSSYSLSLFRVAQVDDDLKGLPAETFAISGSGTRTVAGDRQPGQLAAVLELNTGFSGRRGRGRNFIGVMHEGDQSGGIVDAALRTIIETYGALLVSTFVPATAIGELVIFTKVANTVSVVTSQRCKLPVYTQRRRRAGVGA